MRFSSPPASAIPPFAIVVVNAVEAPRASGAAEDLPSPSRRAEEST